MIKSGENKICGIKYFLGAGMNEIKEDLDIMELEGLEFLDYSLKIMKRNFLNFLPFIIILILLNLYGVYKGEMAYKISTGSYGLKIYSFFADLKMGWFIDEGFGAEWASLGLYHRLRNLEEFVYLLLNSILYPGIIISVCKYIDQNIKTNPLLEIKKSFFKILKFITVEFLAIATVKSALKGNKFIIAIACFFLIFLIVKCIFFFQEYFYQRNSMIKSIKNSYGYSSLMFGFPGVFIAWSAYQLIEILMYYPLVTRVTLVPVNVFLQLLIVNLITLSYFNAKYLNDSETQEEIFPEKNKKQSKISKN